MPEAVAVAGVGAMVSAPVGDIGRDGGVICARDVQRMRVELAAVSHLVAIRLGPALLHDRQDGW